VRLRDFLIGFAEQVADDDFMMPIVLLDGFASWSAKYVGEGWWRVSAQNTGRESNEVTPTPTMTPTVTPIPAPTVVPGPFALPTTTGLSWDELMARFADDSATPTAEPQLVTVTELVSGQWLVSERTGHVAADDDASEAFLECVAIGLVFGCY
jgi:hypothetical protein